MLAHINIQIIIFKTVFPLSTLRSPHCQPLPVSGVQMSADTVQVFVHIRYFCNSADSVLIVL